MKINLKYDDKFTMDQMLATVYEKSNDPLDANKLRQLLEKSFEQASQYFGVLKTDKFAGSEVEIIVTHRSPSGNKNTLAYFDLYGFQPDSKKFSFKVYADVLLPHIREHNFDGLVPLWVHEIMHMVDYKELLRKINLYREKISDTHLLGDSFYFTELRKDKHVVLFNVLMHFRAEGISTLMEYIHGGQKPTITDGVSAIKQFDHVIARVLNTAASDSNTREMYELLENVYPLAYRFGAGVLLFGLSGKYPDSLDFVHINECIIHEKPCEIQLNENILEQISSFSSFDFLRYCMEQDWLANEVKYLTSSYSESIEIQECFFSLLNVIKLNSDRLGYIALLRSLLNETLSASQIEKSHNDMLKDAHIPDEIINYTSILIRKLRDNPDDELILLALTYVFSTHDVLDDSIEYFGYMDDMEVLSIAHGFA